MPTSALRIRITGRAAESVALANGEPFPAWVELMASDETDQFAPGVEIRLVVEQGRTVVGRVAFSQAARGPEVGKSHLRTFPLEEVVKEAIRDTTVLQDLEWAELADRLSERMGDEQIDEGKALLTRMSQNARMRQRRAPTGALFREVARVAQESPSKPNEAVRKHFNTGKRNASRWIAEARHRGFLNGATGAAGEHHTVT